jgi:hypothetical protein
MLLDSDVSGKRRTILEVLSAVALVRSVVVRLLVVDMGGERFH